MKKTIFLRLMGTILLMAGSFAFTSCSSDDDEIKGDVSVSIDNKNIKFDHVGYILYADYEDTYNYDFQICFTDFEINKNASSFPKKINALLIDVYGQGEELPVGTFSSDEYDVALMVNYNTQAETWDYYLDGAWRKNGPLTIEKSGDGYKISMPNLVLEGTTTNDDGEDVTFNTSFSYEGKIPFLFENYDD